MSSIKSNRPQNLNPAALIQAQKDVAWQNDEAVRVAIQAIRQRKTPSHEVTVQLVAKESGVSTATIYRRDELFTLVKRANPKLQRRHYEQVYQDKLVQMESKLADAEKDKEYYKNKVELAKLDIQQSQQEITRLRKKLIDQQREISYMKEQIANCTCSSKERQKPFSMPPQE